MASEPNTYEILGVEDDPQLATLLSHCRQLGELHVQREVTGCTAMERNRVIIKHRLTS